MSVADEFVGQSIECPHCGGVGAPAFDGVEARPGMAVPEARPRGAAAAGPSAGPAMFTARGRLLAKELAFRRSSPQARRWDAVPVGRRLRVSTAITAVLSVLVPVGAVIAARELIQDDTLIILTLLMGLLLGAMILAVAVVMAVHDFSVPHLEDRCDPIRGLKSFLLSMRAGRFQHAWACLVPGEAELPPRLQPDFHVPGVEEDRSFSFGEFSGLAAYWKPYIHQRAVLGRVVSVRGWYEQGREEDFALVGCDLQATKAQATDKSVALYMLLLLFLPRGIALLWHLSSFEKSPQGRNRFFQESMLKLMRRIDDQWCVVCGEVRGPEDARDVLAEAVRIAKLSDSELATEARAAGVEPGVG